VPLLEPRAKNTGLGVGTGSAAQPTVVRMAADTSANAAEKRPCFMDANHVFVSDNRPSAAAALQSTDKTWCWVGGALR
jgi:hypothetical protein